MHIWLTFLPSWFCAYFPVVVVTFLCFGLGGAAGAADALAGGGMGGSLDLGKPFTAAPARAAATVSALSLPAGAGRLRKANLFGRSWAYKRPGGRAALKLREADADHRDAPGLLLPMPRGALPPWPRAR